MEELILLFTAMSLSCKPTKFNSVLLKRHQYNNTINSALEQDVNLNIVNDSRI